MRFVQALFGLNGLLKCSSQGPLRGIHTSIGLAQKLNVSGMFTPISTPFNVDESIAFDKLEQNLSKWNQTDLRGK